MLSVSHQSSLSKLIQYKLRLSSPFSASLQHQRAGHSQRHPAPRPPPHQLLHVLSQTPQGPNQASDQRLVRTRREESCNCLCLPAQDCLQPAREEPGHDLQEPLFGLCPQRQVHLHQHPAYDQLHAAVAG